MNSVSYTHLEEVYEEPVVEEYVEEVYEEPAEQEESLEDILEEAAALERENKESEKKQENRTVFEDGENKGKKHSWTSYLRRRKKTVEEPVKQVQEEREPQQTTAVSYTHLDVYKRQGYQYAHDQTIG